MTIHPLAVVSNYAEIHASVEIGPFCTVEHGVVIGQGCQLASRVTIKQGTILGRGVKVSEGAVLGGLPQLAVGVDEPGQVIVGERCTIRENVTIHRSMFPQGQTRVGAGCLLMAGAHVAHDCEVGPRAILTNNVLLGGHVRIGERACLGGSAAVHQYCRVGRLAMIGGCARVVQDVPPFMLTDGESAMIVGLNRIGLRRAGIPIQEVAQLKQAYRLAYRSGASFADMVRSLDEAFPEGLGHELAEFFRDSRRGFVQERRSPPKAAIRLHPAAESEVVEGRRLAG